MISAQGEGNSEVFLRKEFSNIVPDKKTGIEMVLK